MIKFLRISSLYPSALKAFTKKIKNIEKKSYKQILNLLHKEKYSISNYYSIFLKKKNYQCVEIISNAEFLQNKWLIEYGNSKGSESILFQQINYYKPEVIYIGNADLCDKNFINKIKEIKSTKLVIGYHCAPFTKKIYQNLNNVDAVITCTRGYQKEIISKIDKEVLFLPHAFYNNRASLKKIKYSQKKIIDVAFVGSIFLGDGLHNKRVDLIYSIIKNFKNSYIAVNFSNFFILKIFFFTFKSFINFNFLNSIKIYYKLIYIYFFSKRPIFGKEMYSIFRKTKILINSHIGDTKYAGNMRMFEGTGTGCLLLTDNKIGNTEFFKPKKEIIIYNNFNLVDLCKYYLKNIDKLKTISLNGMAKTFKYHNYYNRVQMLDIFIKNILKKKSNKI